MYFIYMVQPCLHIWPHVPVKPRELALITILTPPRTGPAYAWQLSRTSRLPSQTSTSAFYSLFPHSYASKKDFPVGHPSQNCFRPNTLNLIVFIWASIKEGATCCYLINPIKLWGTLGWYKIVPITPTFKNTLITEEEDGFHSPKAFPWNFAWWSFFFGGRGDPLAYLLYPLFPSYMLWSINGTGDNYNRI